MSVNKTLFITYTALHVSATKQPSSGGLYVILNGIKRNAPHDELCVWHAIPKRNVSRMNRVIVAQQLRPWFYLLKQIVE
jgi:hypothetical protein